jgi:hypothetical protein
MRLLVLAAAILALGGAAYAQTGDAPKAKAACQASGKPAKGSACARKRKNDGTDDGAVSISRCRDVRSHRFTKCGGPYAEPVPAN